MSNRNLSQNRTFQTLTYSRHKANTGSSVNSENGHQRLENVKELKLPKFIGPSNRGKSQRSASKGKRPDIKFRTSSFPAFLAPAHAPSPTDSGPNLAELKISEECRRKADAEKERILTSAAAEAAGILISAEAEAENLKRATFSKAQEDGLKEAQAKITQHIAHLDELFERLTTTQKRCYQQHEEELVRLALTCAKQLINREISLDEKVIVDTVNEILQEGQIQGDATLLLNNDDFNLIDQLRPELLSEFPKLANLKIEVSDIVERGGCILESPMGRIDASLRSKFEELERLLING